MDRLLGNLICVLLATLARGQQTQQVLAQCHEDQHKTLQDSYRSTGFDLRPSDIQKCDDGLEEGWYRFLDINGASVEMPTTCPGRNNCGTVTPFWIKGEHPAVKDGITELTLCAQLSDNSTTTCCEFKKKSKKTIFVINCGNFYLYNLKMAHQCPMGYCAGSIKRCSPDQWSKTDFQPCKDRYPILKDLPTLKGPIVYTDKPFEFRCQITYSGNEDDQRFEIVWTFNGNPDPNIKASTLVGIEREAVLSAEEAKQHINEEVGCQVRSYYRGRENDKSPTFLSKEVFLGVKEPPQLIGPTVRNGKTFDFQCQINYPTAYRNQEIEVVWTFDNMQDPAIAPTILIGQNRLATLAGIALKAHLNKHIDCQARLVFAEIKTEFHKSNRIFFGIKIDPGSIDINAQDTKKELTITSTIPVVCDNGPNCCWTYKMMVSKQSVVNLQDSCELKICSKNWIPERKRAVLKIILVPFRNDVSAGVRTTTLSFESLMPTGTGEYISLIENYKPNPIQVTVTLEAGFWCSLTGDPHVRGFDYPHTYHFYEIGEYIAYQVKDRDFEVQVKTYRCGKDVSCACGIFVKEMNTVIKINGCDKLGHMHTATVDLPYKYSPGTTILRSMNARDIGIILPSGSEIKLDLHETWINIYIKSPAFDRNKIQGICGTNDGNKDNDFTHRDGKVTLPCPQHVNCVPKDFTESWRVIGKDSYFVVNPTQKPEGPTPQYCSCDSSDRKPDVCSPSQHNKVTTLVCSGCSQITDLIQPKTWGQREDAGTVSSDKQWSDDPDTSYDDELYVADIAETHHDWNDEFVFNDDIASHKSPNKRQIREERIPEDKAKEMCNNSIYSSQLFSRCQNAVDNLFNNAMSDCMQDIMVGGITTMLDSIISSFTTNCQIELAKDESNYQRDENGVEVMLPVLLDDVCSLECRKHGVCGFGGKCVCNPGWEGNTCHIETGKGPQISMVTSGSICHAWDKICESVDLTVTNINLMDKLQCQVYVLDALDVKSSNPIMKNTLNEGSPVAVCALPQTRVSTLNFTVSVTKDGVLFSNELRVQTYDSLCLSCSESGCVEKKTACHIDNVCYRHKQVKGNDASLVCNVNRDTNAWSQNDSNSGITAAYPTSLIKILTIATILVTSVSNFLSLIPQ